MGVRWVCWDFWGYLVKSKLGKGVSKEGYFDLNFRVEVEYFWEMVEFRCLLFEKILSNFCFRGYRNGFFE